VRIRHLSEQQYKKLRLDTGKSWGLCSRSVLGNSEMTDANSGASARGRDFNDMLGTSGLEAIVALIEGEDAAQDRGEGAQDAAPATPRPMASISRKSTRATRWRFGAARRWWSTNSPPGRSTTESGSCPWMRWCGNPDRQVKWIFRSIIAALIGLTGSVSQLFCQCFDYFIGKWVPI
jgi:hypothetical protein